MKLKVKSFQECKKIDPTLQHYKPNYFMDNLANKEIEVEESGHAYFYKIKGTRDLIRKTFCSTHEELMDMTPPIPEKIEKNWPKIETKTITKAQIEKIKPIKEAEIKAEPSEYVLSLWEEEFEQWIAGTPDYVNLETFTEHKVIKYVYHEREWQGYLASKMANWRQMNRIQQFANDCLAGAQMSQYQEKCVLAIVDLSNDEHR